MGAAGPILIADGDRASRELVAGLLRQIGDEPRHAQTGEEALELAIRLRPALVLLEVNLPEVSGYEVCRELREHFGEGIAIIFLSGQRTEPYDRVAGLLLGADDYVVKPFDADELLARARAALRRIHLEHNGNDVVDPAGASLTTREREVLGLLAGGLSQAEISAKLFISPKTVAGHIQRVLAKLGLHSRAQAVAFAHQNGLADVEAHALSV
jgi:DNA-binding NarL/FixJ family response regulator